jgi:hypothetical protein
MKECVRENEIVEAVVSGRWPDACGADLRNHVSACHICKEVAVVAGALQEEHDTALAEARVPSAGLVWWRAELRARREGAKAAERPLTLVHSLAAASVIGVGAALVGGMIPYVRELFAAFAGLPELGLLIGAFVTLLVVAPLALYFVFSDK